MSNEALAPNGLDLMVNKIINMADPSAPLDGVNLQTLMNYVAGLNWKAEVQVVATTNGALATAYEAGDTVDGYVLQVDDRILLVGQTAGQENGIRVVQASGAPVRSSDANSTAELRSAIVPVARGTVSANTWWQLVTDNVVVDTTPQVWQKVQFGIIYTGSLGVQLVGNDFRVKIKDSSISVDVDGIYTTRQQIGAAGKYATDSPALLAGIPANIPHGLGNADPIVQVYLSTGEKLLDLGIKKVDADNISIVSNIARAAAYYRVDVVG